MFLGLLQPLRFFNPILRETSTGAVRFEDIPCQTDANMLIGPTDP